MFTSFMTSSLIDIGTSMIFSFKEYFDWRFSLLWGSAPSPESPPLPKFEGGAIGFPGKTAFDGRSCLVKQNVSLRRCNARAYLYMRSLPISLAQITAPCVISVTFHCSLGRLSRPLGSQVSQRSTALATASKVEIKLVLYEKWFLYHYIFFHVIC